MCGEGWVGAYKTLSIYSILTHLKVNDICTLFTD